MNKKGIAALGLSLMMAGTMLTGCGSGDSDGAGKKADAKGSVYQAGAGCTVAGAC